LDHKLTATQHISHTSGDPAYAYAQWRAQRGLKPGLLLVDFSIQADWVAKAHQQALTAIYCLGSNGSMCLSVTEKALVTSERDHQAQYALWLREHSIARVLLGGVLPLGPVFIPKPWGREIWFTGVEERGVCNVVSPEGQTPIPWIQAAMPQLQIGAANHPLILLKILDPSAKVVQGDLYFELHEQKREVYVVTHIDPDAWPDGTGYIRYGFSPDKLAQYPDAKEFRRRYLEAVQNYEELRRALDGAVDSSKSQQSVPDKALLARERDLRETMDSYTHLRPLRVGDVVKVPLLTPHSLQHGVRTIEFQTPVYERKILSFAQEVVTQNHWDTIEAVAQMNLHTPLDTPFTTLRNDDQVRIERIVDFDDFEVHRVQMTPSATLEKMALDSYLILIVVQGTLAIEGNNYGPEEALILPLAWAGKVTSNGETGAVSFLLAIPRNKAVES
jgi:hypothetical protein